jgi:uncharacterized Zn finger protein
VNGIANILHRETIAMIVGSKTFERGEQCFNGNRVLGVESAPGQLCGIVKPQEAGRVPYEIRIWIRDDGLAFECSCPVGVKLTFCKHAVAVALAHLRKQQQKVELELVRLRGDLMGLSINSLLDGLIAQARVDPGVFEMLRSMTRDN